MQPSGKYQMAQLVQMLYQVTINGKEHRLNVSQIDGRWVCSVDGRALDADAVLVRSGVLSLRLGNNAYEVKSERVGGDWRLWVGSSCFTVELRDPRSLQGRVRAGDAQGPKKITAAMPGKVVRVLLKEGDGVESGQGIAVVEAMKMQNEIKSPKKGIVQKLLINEGTAVNAGDVLAIVE